MKLFGHENLVWWIVRFYHKKKNWKNCEHKFRIKRTSCPKRWKRRKGNKDIQTEKKEYAKSAKTTPLCVRIRAAAVASEIYNRWIKSHQDPTVENETLVDWSRNRSSLKSERSLIFSSSLPVSLFTQSRRERTPLFSSSSGSDLSSYALIALSYSSWLYAV